LSRIAVPALPPYEVAALESSSQPLLEDHDERHSYWRLPLPEGIPAPTGARLMAETYRRAPAIGFTLDEFFIESNADEAAACPGADASIVERAQRLYLYEQTAPSGTNCWPYQLVRLEQGRSAFHALILLAEQRPSPEIREAWLSLLAGARLVSSE
jgi:hypothetical protein